jgi:diaminohydroxyphosphoribosylaminopyrimidine deaminase/5-amino-6-(5-phosphoribosylamino)uracil reductase
MRALSCATTQLKIKNQDLAFTSLGGIVAAYMSSQAVATPVEQRGAAADSAWNILRAASTLAETLDRAGQAVVFGLDEHEGLRSVPVGSPDAVLAWQPGAGWESRLPPGDGHSELVNLYLPLCSATVARPITVGHLGQSLDGFIATPSGDSRFVTGNDNIVHVHRMRALCDAVVVGAGTVAADDPQLTTRHVSGPNPLRVVFDPGRRLSSSFRVFTDKEVPTLYICARSRIAAGESQMGESAIAGIDHERPADGASQVLHLLRARGCARVFVEGGGVTVSAFLEANLLDRLQITIAPVIIGDGHPAIRVAPHTRLHDCRRPGYRVFRMGGDVLFDCNLHEQADATDSGSAGAVHRII